MIVLAYLDKEELALWPKLKVNLHELLERRISDGVKSESSNDQI